MGFVRPCRNPVHRRGVKSGRRPRNMSSEKKHPPMTSIWGLKKKIYALKTCDFGVIVYDFRLLWWPTSQSTDLAEHKAGMDDEAIALTAGLWNFLLA